MYVYVISTFRVTVEHEQETMKNYISAFDIMQVVDVLFSFRFIP